MEASQQGSEGFNDFALPSQLQLIYISKEHALAPP